MLEVAAVVGAMVAPIVGINTFAAFVYIDCFKLFHPGPSVLPEPAAASALASGPPPTTVATR